MLQELGKFLSNSEKGHVQACITWQGPKWPKSNFYVLWQQHKCTEMSKIWPDTYEKGYLRQL